MVRREFLGRLGAAVGAAPLLGCSSSAEAAAESAYPPVGRFVEVEGLKLHYVDEGEGPALVLIHGASGNLRDWTFSMTSRLKDRYRVIAFDRPGHGYSGRPDEQGHDPSVQARLLAAGADALGVERAIVVGHSWGGSVTTAWALARPDQTAGAVSIAGATYPWGGDGGFLYRIGASAVGGAVSAAARAYVSGDRRTSVVRDVFAPNAMPPGYAEHIGIDLALRSDTFQWNAEDINRLNDHLKTLAPRYGEIAAPVEVLHGDADETVYLDVHSLPLAEAVANGRLTVLPGVGHMPHHVREGQVVDAIDRVRAAAFG
ncbi:MAG: alpha/beta hydrolase [Pseudomonadota bacterium]